MGAASSAGSAPPGRSIWQGLRCSSCTGRQHEHEEVQDFAESLAEADASPMDAFRTQSQPGKEVFRAGDRVHVWSNSKNRWIEDGLVQDALEEEGRLVVARGVGELPAGSVKVAFNNGLGVKWVLPRHLPSVLRAATRSDGGSTPSMRHPEHRPRPAPVGPSVPPPVMPRRSSWSEEEDMAQEEDVDPEPQAGLHLVCSGVDDTLAELIKVEEQCRESGEPYEDPDFEPYLVPGPDGISRITSWSRPGGIGRHDGKALDAPTGIWRFFQSPIPVETEYREWQVFRGQPRSDDVQQGELGDCWFLSSLAALAEFQGGSWVRKLLPGQDGLSPHGVYMVRLCLGGRWQNIVVDDRLPCIGGGSYYTQLAYCVTNRRQLWASLIEKAFAKVCGSFEVVAGGEAGEALTIFTGWPCTLIRIARPDFDPDMLWATLCSSKDSQFLMTCSTGPIRPEDEQSLVPNHVYSLLDVYEVERDGAQVQLLKIRNPHTRLKWQGAWSDDSPEWTPLLRVQLGCPEGGVAGVFFMAYRDFLLCYAHCTICRIRSREWEESRKDLRLPAGEMPCVGVSLEVMQSAEVSLTLAQPEERMRQGPIFRDQFLDTRPACIGFVLLDPSEEEASATIGTAHLRSRPGVSSDCWLQAGREYVAVPMCLLDAEFTASIACVGSQAVAMRDYRLKKDAVRRAWAAYARANDASGGESFQGAVLYLGKAEGGSIVVLAENRSKVHLRVELAMESTGIRFSRGADRTSDWLAPGQAQIVQVGMPDESKGRAVSWRSKHAFQMTGKEPGGPLQEPPVQSDGLHAPFRLPAPAAKEDEALAAEA